MDRFKEGCENICLCFRSLKTEKDSTLTFLILVLSDIYPLCLWFACRYPCGPFALSFPNLFCQTTAFFCLLFKLFTQKLWTLNLTTDQKEMTEINPFLTLRWIWAWKLCLMIKIYDFECSGSNSPLAFIYPYIFLGPPCDCVSWKEIFFSLTPNHEIFIYFFFSV